MNSLQKLEWSQTVPFPKPLVWQFFADARNLAGLTPPEAGFEAGEIDGPVYEGQILTHRVRIFPGIKATWVTEIRKVQAGEFFVDAQEMGPFRFWRHRHSFSEVPGGTKIRDTVYWALPMEPFSWWVRPFVRRQLKKLFRFRESALLAELQRFAAAEMDPAE